MIIARLFLILFLVQTIWSQQVPEPPNIGKLKNAVKYYIESGSYEADIAKVYKHAQAFIEQNLKEDTKYAVVMDIDETTLSNIIYENRFGYGYSHKTWSVWVAEKQAVAIPAAKAFYDWGREKGITFFFVTGRKQQGTDLEVDPTVVNMKAEGFDQYGKIYLKPKIKGLKTVDYKSGARKEITAQGYVIIANIGDQLSDLEGGFSLSRWKIPNPMYYVK